MALFNLFRRRFRLTPAQRRRVERMPLDEWKYKYDRPPFFIVGPARSGTAYIAEVLTAAGVPTGHEDMFGKYGFDARPELRGDSSWLAVPFLEDIPAVCPIVFQTRDPVKVVESNFRIRFLQRDSKFDEFARAVLGARLPAAAAPLERCVLYVVEWLEMIRLHQDRIVLTRRLESLDASDVSAMGAAVGYPIEPERAADAIAAIPKNVNTKLHRKTAVAVDWSGVSAELRDRLHRLRDELGYGPR